MSEEEKKGEYDTRINKARPVDNVHTNKRDLEEPDTTTIRKSQDRK
jgi:hypothetical protein